MKKYGVIYADPPWAYRVWSQKGKGRSAESHYSTMSLDDIKALPVGELADKDCALFMWITFPTRANAEVCIIATKGSPKRQSRAVHQIIMSPIKQHSKKPDETRERIVALMGDVPRIELFARQKTEGWDVWGNEAPDSVELPGMEVK